VYSITVEVKGYNKRQHKHHSSCPSPHLRGTTSDGVFVSLPQKQFNQNVSY
jgi:hypothetical protein